MIRWLSLFGIMLLLWLWVAFTVGIVYTIVWYEESIQAKLGAVIQKKKSMEERKRNAKEVIMEWLSRYQFDIMRSIRR